MARDHGVAQAPPIDLPKRKLPLRASPALTWCRIGKSNRDPIHFSTNDGWRFSRPDMPGVLYLGETPEVCFWEIFWDELVTRPEDERRLDSARVDERSIWSVDNPRELRLVDTFHPETLRAIGAHGGTFSGPYSICQEWAFALRNHPDRPDGMLYESVRHRGGRCLALFGERFEGHAWNHDAGTRLRDAAEIAHLLLAHGIPSVGH